MSKGLRKITRTSPQLSEHRVKAQAFWKYGSRAVAMAAECRRQGLRDLVVPVAQVAECIADETLKRRAAAGPKCEFGGWGRSTCTAPAVILIITDSDYRGFFCEEHAEQRVVRL